MDAAWAEFLTGRASSGAGELPDWIGRLGLAADEVLDVAVAGDPGLAALESATELNALTERLARRHGDLAARLGWPGPRRGALGTLGAVRGRVLL